MEGGMKNVVFSTGYGINGWLTSSWRSGFTYAARVKGQKKTGGEKDGSEPDNFDYWGVKFSNLEMQFK